MIWTNKMNKDRSDMGNEIGINLSIKSNMPNPVGWVEWNGTHHDKIRCEGAKILHKLVYLLCLLITFSFQWHISAQEGTSVHHLMSFAVTPDWVKAKLNKTPKPVIVDVRRPESFEKIRIPQSINLPLYAIKTKLFLRNKQVVLVNEGFDYMALAEEARKLKQSGYSVSILYGGLNAWQNSNGNLLGDAFAIENLNKVSAQALYRQKGFASLKIIDVSNDDKNTSSNTLTIGNQVAMDKLSEYLSAGLVQNEQMLLLIANNRGTEYEKIEKIVKNTNAQNVFYLKGGLAAYDQYLNDLHLAMAPREDRLVTKGACDSCAK